MTRTVWVEEVFDWKSGSLDFGEKQQGEERGEENEQKDQSSRHEGVFARWDFGLTGVR